MAIYHLEPTYWSTPYGKVYSRAQAQTRNVHSGRVVSQTLYVDLKTGVNVEPV